MTRRLGRALALVAVLLLAAGSVAAPIRAEEPPAPVEKVKEAAGQAVEAVAPKKPGPMDAFLEQMGGSEAALWGMGLIQGLGGILGLVLLVRFWLRWDAERGRVLAGAAPPARLPPTRPFALGPAIGLFLGSMVATTLVLVGLAEVTGMDTKSFLEKLPLTLGVQVAAGLPFVAAILIRRRRSGDPLPRLPRAVGVGVRAWLVALAVVFPAGLVSFVVLRALGQTPEPQDLVQVTLDAATPAWEPWLIFGYGVVAAPILEESLFRGLLYPAIRSAAGGGRRGVWVAVLVTALLFAAVHAHLPSLLPLFVLALLLALVFERTNSLAGVMIAHGLFNMGSLVPVLLARGA